MKAKEGRLQCNHCSFIFEEVNPNHGKLFPQCPNCNSLSVYHLHYCKCCNTLTNKTLNNKNLGILCTECLDVINDPSFINKTFNLIRTCRKLNKI